MSLHKLAPRDDFELLIQPKNKETGYDFETSTAHQLQLLAKHNEQTRIDGSTVKDPNTTTVRNDGGKNRVDLIPVRPLERIAEVMTAGAQKYPERNWEPGMAWSRCYASALRHLFAWWRGEDKDPQTGLSHLAHCACNILFLLEYQELKKGTDDRP